MTDIKAIARRFNVATEARAAADKALRDLDLDIAIAERNGEPKQPIMDKRNLVLRGEWASAHAAQQEALTELFAALEISDREVRRVFSTRAF